MSQELQFQEPPEDSKALRLVVLIMALLCVVASSYFVRTEWWLTIIYLVMIVAGSFLSYQLRYGEPRWLKLIWWIGIPLVGANALREFTGPLRDEFDYVSPFVHFLGGIFVFVTFSMKSRSDLNLASGLGLMLLCLAAPVAKGLPYGACVMAYMVLGAIMMYYDCVSRTLNSWLSQPIVPAPEIEMSKYKRRRIPRGNTVLLLTVVPLMALAMFLYVPRADEFLDKIWAYSKAWNIEALTDMFFSAAKTLEPPRNESHERTARSWFTKNTDVNMKQLPRKEEYNRDLRKKQEKEKKEKEAKEKKGAQKADKSPPSDEKPKLPDGKANPPSKEEKKKGKPAKVGKSQDQAAKAKEDAKERDGAKSKDKVELNKDQGENKDASKAEAGNVETDTKDGAKEGKKKGKKERETSKDEKKGKADKADKKSDDAASAHTKSGASDKKSAGQKGEKGEGKGEGKGKDGKGEGKGKDGKGEGKDGKGEGKDGKGEGKDGKGGGKDGKGEGKDGKGNKEKRGEKGKGAQEGKSEGKDGKSKDGKGGKAGTAAGKKGGKKSFPTSDAVIGGDDVLMLEGTFDSDDDRILMTVKSRRLVFLRRQCYDFFNGKMWKRTPLPPKEKPPAPVKVVDNVLPKETKVVKLVQIAPTYGVKTNAPTTYYTPTAPTQFGQRQPTAQQLGGQPSVLANPATPVQTSVLANPNNPQPEPVKPAQEPVPVATPTAQPPAPKTVRSFTFESTERPIYRVGMADALKPTKTLPTVDLVQEIKVRAKSIGVVLPAGWIPQEVRIDKQKKIAVDQLGVISTATPIGRNAEFKVRTELPIYPIEAMRKEMPISPDQEDEIRGENRRYLQLPKTVSEPLFKLAEDNADPRYNWFVQCEQICNYLRENYKYDALREVDADCDDLVQDFLFERQTGHCSDFASAFVMMTRCIGIPSRMVGGFAPGDHNTVTGEQEVKMKHRHAWAEAYIPKFGWVPFDATPDGILPDVKRENPYTQKEVEKTLGLDKPAANGMKWTDIAGCIVAGLFALLVGFIVFKVLIKLYRRWLEANFGRGPEWKLYKKVAKSVKKSMKLVRYPSETPTEFLERVQTIVTDRKAAGKISPEGLPEALGTFLKTYSAVYFGRKKSEMENLRYHCDQVVRVVRSVKITDIVDSTTTAVRRKDKADEAASSAVRKKR